LVEGNITQPARNLEVPKPSQPDTRNPSAIEAHPRFVEAAGYRLETCCYGSPDAPLRIVLLHEGLGSVAAWRDFPVRLAEQLGEPVLAYSRPGYGQSDAPRYPRSSEFMHHEAREVLPSLLGTLGIAHPVLVGHSDGASIALIHAGTFGPETDGAAAGVAVLAPHLFVEEITVDEIAKVSNAFEPSALAARLARYHRDPVGTFHGWAHAWLSPAFRDWNIEDAVARIRCPLLAIQGRQDQYGTEEQIRRLLRLQPSARALLLEDCRHVPHQEQPLAVLAALTGFLAGLTR
jgi:pimeloyl-ACP methyl ester carboxylesterase